MCIFYRFALNGLQAIQIVHVFLTGHGGHYDNLIADTHIYLWSHLV